MLKIILTPHSFPGSCYPSNQVKIYPPLPLNLGRVFKVIKTINMASEDDIKGAEISRRLSLSRHFPCKYSHQFRSKLLYHNHNSRNSEDSEIVSHLQEKRLYGQETDGEWLGDR